MQRIQQSIEHWKNGELGLAAELLEGFLADFPEHPVALANLANVYRAWGRIDEALDTYQRALVLWEEGEEAQWVWSNYLMTLNYAENIGLQELFDAHQRWGKNCLPVPEGDVIFKNPITTERRVHVGFVSGDFRWHSVAFFLLGLLRNLNRDDFEVTCFSDNQSDDEMSNILRGLSGAWVQTREMNDSDLVKLVRRSRVDVLVDLSGHTAYNRMAAFAQRMAPVQVSWLGYPMWTGNPGIDHWLSDAVICGGFGPTYASAMHPILLHPGIHAYHSPLDELSAEREGTAQQGLMLGCFNHRAKISRETVRMWSSIMKLSPDCRLMLKSGSFADERASGELRELFEAFGVDAKRIILMPRTASTREHLECYRKIDIALDTYPYNGTTTTCESLWMGVPVVSRMGETPAARVSGSILKQLGRSDWIALDEQGYVAAVLGLIADVPARAQFRAQSRVELFRSGLTDHQAFTNEWSRVVRKVWADYVKKRS